MNGTRQRSKMVKLGLFMVTGTILFITGLYYASNVRYIFGGTIRLSGVFNNAAGLVVGNNVTMSGINVGTVDDIKIINDTAVRVFFIVDKEIRKFIKKDAVAFISSEGLMGDKSVNLKPGSQESPVIENDDVLLTVNPFEKDKLMNSLNGTSERVEGITADVNAIVGNVKNGKGAVGLMMSDSLFATYLLQSIININQSTNELNKLINQTRKNIELAGININSATKNLNDISVITKDSILTNLVATSKNASNITLKMSETLTTLNDGNGTLSKLLSDTTMAGDVESTIANLKNGSDEFNELLTATKGSFLFRGYFKKQAKLEQKQKAVSEQQKHNLLYSEASKK